VIVISYAEYEPHELKDFAPRIVFVDARNRRSVPGSDAVVEEGRHEA
jgi:aspartate 1-decarboxylase